MGLLVLIIFPIIFQAIFDKTEIKTRLHILLPGEYQLIILYLNRYNSWLNYEVLKKVFPCLEITGDDHLSTTKNHRVDQTFNYHIVSLCLFIVLGSIVSFILYTIVIRKSVGIKPAIILVRDGFKTKGIYTINNLWLICILRYLKILLYIIINSSSNILNTKGK